MAINKNIWNDLREHLDLSVALYQGALSWAKVCDGQAQDIQVYFTTTLEVLNKTVANISDSPDRLRHTIKNMEEEKYGLEEQEVIIDSVRKHLEVLKEFRDETKKLITLGEQIEEDQQALYLKKIAQDLYRMAESMNDASVSLKTVLKKTS